RCPQLASWPGAAAQWARKVTPAERKGAPVLRRALPPAAFAEGLRPAAFAGRSSACRQRGPSACPSAGRRATVRTGHRPVTVLQHAVRVELAEALDHPGHQAGPPGLVRGAEPGPVVPVEVLVKQDEVTPVRVLLENPVPAVDGAQPVAAAQEGARQPAG